VFQEALPAAFAARLSCPAGGDKCRLSQRPVSRRPARAAKEGKHAIDTVATPASNFRRVLASWEDLGEEDDTARRRITLLQPKFISNPGHAGSPNSLLKLQVKPHLPFLNHRGNCV
jgi:hypothetical protein